MWRGIPRVAWSLEEPGARRIGLVSVSARLEMYLTPVLFRLPTSPLAGCKTTIVKVLAAIMLEPNCKK